jgi:translocation and assembly module TamB
MKTLRSIMLVAVGLLLALLLCVAALWSWSGSDTSLATTLAQITRLLPAGQTLEVNVVKGSLRNGGSIGWLRWQQGQLSVEVTDLTSEWGAGSLWAGELRLTRLRIGQVRIEDRRTATVPTPPGDLRLPLRIDAHISVATLEWAGPNALQLANLVGHYRFDGQAHRLDNASAQMAAGSYRFSGRLEAQAPMQVVAQLQGSVQTALPSSRQNLNVNAQLDVKGQLAGRDATLELQARLTPDKGAATDAAMQGKVLATLQPWQPQPVVGATAQWQALNLAALWPQAPQTRLSGSARVTPTGQGWQAVIELDNAQAGAWNQQRLPLDSLRGTLAFTQGQWTVQSLQANAGGGHINAQGSVGSATANTDSRAPWQGSATLQGVNPAAIDSRLATTRLDGRLTAQQTPAGIAFDAQLQTNTAHAVTTTGTLAGLRLKALQARGLWLAPALRIDALSLQTDDAQLQGQFKLQTDTRAFTGQLNLTLPGARATLEGELASSRGQGDIGVQISDAAQARQWLARWPGSPITLTGTALAGSASVNGHWQGGWQGQGRSLQIEVRMQSDQLALRGERQDAAQAWRLHALQLELSGTLGAWKLRTQTQAEQAGRHVALAAQAHGAQDSDGLWQAELESAQISAHGSVTADLWTLQLERSLPLRWQRGAALSTLDIGAGSARLSATLPGLAVVNWQSARWSQQGGRRDWHTQGTVQGLPLAWLDRLGQTAMATMGVSGDLLLGGQWDASGGAALQLRATLQRSSGDLLLQTGDANLGTLRAGISDARLVLSADGERLTGSLRWASERAGQVQADFSSRLLRQDEGWSWPVDAPLSGTLIAQLPPLTNWSRLAPPGWRLRGTLEARAELSGTRGAPQWHGTLLAQDLAVSSVVDGIDFSKGTLRARLSGQRMDILEFRLTGAGTSNPGSLSATGSVDWPATSDASATLRSRLRIALDFQADALRVSALADRRLVLSGQVSARLADARLTVRGKLKADQALFVLPEDTAPRLGDDVLLRSPVTSAAPRSGPSAAAAIPATASGVTPDVVVSLDFGPHFQVRGHGLATRLGGELELRSGAGSVRTPRLSGELRALGGTYKAYGQQLTIEEGVLRFNGQYDNPALDILATRPQLQQRVGVRISGSVLSPIVRLYADPDLPDAEKLSWLVLGRAPVNGGSEAAMLQQAALSLLGGKEKGVTGSLANAFGLDQLSLGSSANSSAGTTTSETTVTLGKNIARNFYVAYERGLTSALGSFYIFYELSRQFTLRAQTGEQSTLDLIFTLRYD